LFFIDPRIIREHFLFLVMCDSEPQAVTNPASCTAVLDTDDEKLATPTEEKNDAAEEDTTAYAAFLQECAKILPKNDAALAACSCDVRTKGDVMHWVTITDQLLSQGHIDLALSISNRLTTPAALLAQRRDRYNDGELFKALFVGPLPSTRADVDALVAAMDVIVSSSVRTRCMHVADFIILSKCGVCVCVAKTESRLEQAAEWQDFADTLRRYCPDSGREQVMCLACAAVLCINVIEEVD
jgi:hypothetical protein